jgi:hypothetical protein
MSLSNDALSDTVSLLLVRTPVNRRDGIEETINRENSATLGGQEQTGGTLPYRVLNSVLGQPMQTVDSGEAGTTFSI